MRGHVRRLEKSIWAIVVLVLLALGYGLWRQFAPAPAPLVAPVAPQAPVPQASPAPAPEPAVKFPLPTGETPEAAMQAPVEPPPDAMAAFERDLSALVDPTVLGRYFGLQGLVRRLVSTVDNITADQLPARARAVAPIRGSFAVRRGPDGITLDPSNYVRYEPFVALLESIDTRKAVALYTRHYRLFQGEYRGQGSPNRYFNDRVVAAIDHLLATPEPATPVRLVQPKVLYRFEDPALESLSAAQKAMIRMGPKNAARVKTKLRAVLAEIARQGAAPR